MSDKNTLTKTPFARKSPDVTVLEGDLGPAGHESFGVRIKHLQI